MQREVTYGIDLGTTCSTIGLVDDGVPRLLPVDARSLLPSIVSFPENGPALVGQSALNRYALDPENTIRSAKRLMGSEHRWQVRGQSISPTQVAGEILDTNATHRQGSRVTLMEFDFGEILSNAEALQAMAVNKPGSVADMKEIMQLIPGLRMEIEPEVAVSIVELKVTDQWLDDLDLFEARVPL